MMTQKKRAIKSGEQQKKKTTRTGFDRSFTERNPAAAAWTPLATLDASSVTL